MPRWSLGFRPEAEDDLAKLDEEMRKRVIEKLNWLQENFDHIIPLALGEGWKGFFKLRVGNWRVIYKVNWSKNSINVELIDLDRIYKRKRP